MMFNENKLKGPKGPRGFRGVRGKLDRKECRLNQGVIHFTLTKLNV
jgi:hypothetical protein